MRRSVNVYLRKDNSRASIVDVIHPLFDVLFFATGMINFCSQQLFPVDLELAAPVIGNPTLTGDDTKVQLMPYA